MKHRCSIGIAMSLTKGRAYRLQTYLSQMVDKIRHRRKPMITCLRQYTKTILDTLSSAIFRGGFGISPGRRRDAVGTASASLRLLFDSEPKSSRTAPEAESKPTRRVPEALPNTSRTGAEQLPSTTQTRVWLKSAIFDKFASFSQQIRPTCQVLVKHYLSTDVVLFTQLLRKIMYKGEMYLSGTGQVQSDLLPASSFQKMSLASHTDDYRMSLARAYDKPSKSLPIDCLSTGLTLASHTDDYRASLLIVQQKGAERLLSRVKRGFSLSLCGRDRAKYFFRILFDLNRNSRISPRISLMKSIQNRPTGAHPKDKSRLGQYFAKIVDISLNISEPFHFVSFRRSVLNGFFNNFLTRYRSSSVSLNALKLKARTKWQIAYCKMLITCCKWRIAYCKVLIACSRMLIVLLSAKSYPLFTKKEKLTAKKKKPIAHSLLLIAAGFNCFAKALKNILAVLILASMFNLSAQESRSNSGTNGSTAIKPLQIGDTIPEELWHMPLQVVNHPDGKNSVTLNDYRHQKLIVLDFWATWCVPCIASLKKLSGLQSHFGDELIVLPITNETEAKWQRFQTIQQLSLPSVIEERRVQQYFPHKVVPHQIWIKDGKLLVKASAEYATVANIRKAMAGQHVKTMTYEAEGGQTLDALLEGGWQDGNIRPQMYSAMYHRIRGESSAIRKESNRFAAINFPIVGLFQLAFSNHIPFGEMVLRTAIEIDDPTLKAKVNFMLLRTGDFGRDSLLSAQADSLQYTYVVEKMDGLSKKSALDKMEQDVRSFFRDRYGLEAYISQRPVKCLLLERMQDIGKLPTTHTIDSSYYRYDGVPALVQALRYQCKAKGYYVVDGVEGPRDLTVALSQQLDDIESFNRSLSSYGLRLQETTREMPVLVLTDGRRKYEN